MVNESWWARHNHAFDFLFSEKNKRLWKLVWDKIGAKAWIAGYIKAHLQFGLPGDRPSVEDVKELRFPDAKAYFVQHGLQFVTEMTETDKNRLHADLLSDFGVGEKAFARKYKTDSLICQTSFVAFKSN